MPGKKSPYWLGKLLIFLYFGKHVKPGLLEIYKLTTESGKSGMKDNWLLLHLKVRSVAGNSGKFVTGLKEQSSSLREDGRPGNAVN